MAGLNNMVIGLGWIAAVLLQSSCSHKHYQIENNGYIMLRPNYLKNGDTIMILSPAGAIKDSNFVIKAMQLMEERGFVVKISEHAFGQDNYFSQIDSIRIEELQKAVNDPNIKAIWCSRGGYGCGRIVDKIDWSPMVKQRKWMIGYSDITVFHQHLNKMGIETIHGIMPNNCNPQNKNFDVLLQQLIETLHGNKLEYSVATQEKNQYGEARSILIGGNLSLIVSNIGTKSEVDPTDKILFIEEIDEKKYHLDRMLYQLKRNGYFRKCKGVIIGGMTQIEEGSPAFGHSVEDIFLSAIDNPDIPILFGFPAGHDSDNRVIIMGREVQLNVETDVSKLIFQP